MIYLYSVRVYSLQFCDGTQHCSDLSPEKENMFTRVKDSLAERAVGRVACKTCAHLTCSSITFVFRLPAISIVESLNNAQPSVLRDYSGLN